MYALHLLLALPIVGFGQEPLPADGDQVPWEIVREESVFAVVTQKAGFAARLAHNHLVVARGFRVRLDLDPERPEDTSFEFETATAGLVVDDPDERARWEARVAALGLVNELGAPDEGDRRKIREEMLAEGQLDLESHPRISARLLRVTRSPVTVGNETFDYTAQVAVAIHGQTVQRDVAARFEAEGDELRLEAVGTFTFTEFGIKPYSAFLGSVKNKDEFFLYLNLEGRR